MWLSLEFDSFARSPYHVRPAAVLRNPGNPHTNYYTDILEFHRGGYKFVRRRSWSFFFKTTWAQFEVRFDAIFTSMAHHSDMISHEALVIDLAKAKKWRDTLFTESEQKEKDRKDQHRAAVVSWLGLHFHPQENEQERFLHVKRLFCGLDSCARGRIGFKTRYDLTCQRKTYHGKGEILVSARIRKVLPSQLELGQRVQAHSGPETGYDMSGPSGMARPRPTSSLYVTNLYI